MKIYSFEVESQWHAKEKYYSFGLVYRGAINQSGVDMGGRLVSLLCCVFFWVFHREIIRSEESMARTNGSHQTNSTWNALLSPPERDSANQTRGRTSQGRHRVLNSCWWRCSIALTRSILMLSIQMFIYLIKNIVSSWRGLSSKRHIKRDALKSLHIKI